MAALLWRALPVEVLIAIARLLLGFEVLRLSHVEHHLLRVLSRAELFASRLSHVRYQRGSTDARDSDLELIHSSTDSKRQYALESSLRFRGQPTDLWAKRLPQSYAPVFLSTDMLFGLYEQEEADSSLSFTMDAWFSLLPHELGARQGGVLLGLQNEKLELESKRWYHVALAFEQRSQKVYLDGELVDSQYDQGQQLESFPYYYAQIGTGFVNDDFYSGWNTFHGVVDDLRIWHEAMSPDQVAELSRGTAAAHILAETRRGRMECRRCVALGLSSAGVRSFLHVNAPKTSISRHGCDKVASSSTRHRGNPLSTVIRGAQRRWAPRSALCTSEFNDTAS